MTEPPHRRVRTRNSDVIGGLPHGTQHYIPTEPSPPSSLGVAALAAMTRALPGLRDTPAWARHTREVGEDEARRPLIVAVDDSPDARLFIELSSHGADLTEASDALNWALHPAQDGPLVDVKPYLIGFAVVAYCRCFLHSNVRTPLGDYVDIPPGMIGIHERIKAFRNQTIAHSQSELQVTYPVGVVDAKTVELHYVSALTVVSTLPDSVANEFAKLISVLLDLLDEVLDPVRGRLEKVIRTADREALVAATPRAVDKMADDFEPRSKRARYPTGHTLYWNREG